MALYLVMWLFLRLSYSFPFRAVGLMMTFTGYGYSQGQMKHCICLSLTIVGWFFPWHFSVWYPYVQWLWSEVKVAQSCSIPCDAMDCSLPGSTVHGIFQARILEWVAIPFSGGSSHPKDGNWLSHIQADSLPSQPPGKHMNGGRSFMSFALI